MDKRIRRVFAETPFWLESSGVPAFTVAVIKDCRIHEVFCFGTLAPRSEIQVTETTIFKAASLSKQVLTYAVLQTIEAGNLDIDRPLEQYLSAPFPANDPDIARITARHVLTHTTGWMNWPNDSELISRICPLGEHWTYSGQAFVYLQIALESILQEPAEIYLKRLVLDPLKMTHSSFIWLNDYEEIAVQGYDEHGNIPEICRWYPVEVDCASTLHTTPRDYAKLIIAYMDPGLRQSHPDVYRQQIPITSRTGWTLGWGIADNALWQWGYHVAFNSFAAFIPETGMGIAVFNNGSKGQRINREWVNAWLGVDLPAFYMSRIEL